MIRLTGLNDINKKYQAKENKIVRKISQPGKPLDQKLQFLIITTSSDRLPSGFLPEEFLFKIDDANSSPILYIFIFFPFGPSCSFVG